VRKILLSLLLIWAGHAFAATVDEADLDRRVTDVTEQLRCLVCQNESIAESQADLARDLRGEVRNMLANGKSEDEVRQFMVARYGNFVLYDPPFRVATIFLWLGPAILALLALAVFVRTLVRRGREKPLPIQADQMAQARKSLTQSVDKS